MPVPSMLWSLTIGLLFAASYLGFLFLISHELINNWTAVLYWAAVLAVGHILFISTFRELPTTPAFPNHVVQRRKWLNTGLMVWAVAVIASMVIRRLGYNDDFADYTVIVGGTVMFICVAVGFFRHPPRPAGID